MAKPYNLEESTLGFEICHLELTALKKLVMEFQTPLEVENWNFIEL